MINFFKSSDHNSEAFLKRKSIAESQKFGEEVIWWVLDPQGVEHEGTAGLSEDVSEILRQKILELYPGQKIRMLPPDSRIVVAAHRLQEEPSHWKGILSDGCFFEVRCENGQLKLQLEGSEPEMIDFDHKTDGSTQRMKRIRMIGDHLYTSEMIHALGWSWNIPQSLQVLERV